MPVSSRVYRFAKVDHSNNRSTVAVNNGKKCALFFFCLAFFLFLVILFFLPRSHTHSLRLYCSRCEISAAAQIKTKTKNNFWQLCSQLLHRNWQIHSRGSREIARSHTLGECGCTAPTGGTRKKNWTLFHRANRKENQERCRERDRGFIIIMKQSTWRRNHDVLLSRY